MSECQHENVIEFPSADNPGQVVQICRNCYISLGTRSASSGAAAPAPPRQQKPSDGRQQAPGRNEEKRPH